MDLSASELGTVAISKHLRILPASQVSISPCSYYNNILIALVITHPPQLRFLLHLINSPIIYTSVSQTVVGGPPTDRGGSQAVSEEIHCKKMYQTLKKMKDISTHVCAKAARMQVYVNVN
jgi:hypothetical protein